MREATFEWDFYKDLQNVQKHGVSFVDAQQAFLDPNRVISIDIKHSQSEQRFYCFGKVKEGVMTVRFIYRDNNIRIIGAGYWRSGRVIYEKENQND